MHSIKRTKYKHNIEFYSMHSSFIHVRIPSFRDQAELINYEAIGTKYYECESVFFP